MVLAHEQVVRPLLIESLVIVIFLRDFFDALCGNYCFGIFFQLRENRG